MLTRLRVLAPWLVATGFAIAAGFLAYPAICIALAWHYLQSVEAGCPDELSRFSLLWSFPEDAAAGCPAPNSVQSATAALRAALFLQRAEQRQGRTAQSIRIRGRLAGAANNFEESSRLLGLASVLNPERCATRLDYGIALAKLGRQRDAPELYVEALDEMAKAAAQPDFPASGYVDLAVLAERVPAPRAAIRFWELASGRRDSPQSLLRRAKQNVTLLKGRLASRVPASAAVEPAKLASDPGYLESLFPQLITIWLCAPVLHKNELNLVASFLERERHDRWLSDLLKQQTQSSRNGSALYASAYQANLAGKAQAANEFARSALQAFSRPSNLPGKMAASIELAQSLRRLGRLPECLSAVKGTSTLAAQRGYPWLALRARFAEVSCQSEGRTVDVLVSRERLLADSGKSGFVDHHLRAIAAVVEPFHSYSMPARAWRRGHLGLKLFWQTPLSGISASNLYIPLAMAAANQGLADTAAILMGEADGVLEGSPNRRLVTQALLGTVQYLTQAGRHAEALTALNLAERTDDPSLKIDLDVARSDLALAMGRTDEALSLLSADLPSPRTLHQFSRYQRLELLPAVGRALLANHQFAEAGRNFSAIVSETKTAALANVDPQQRYFSLAEGEGAWRGLVTSQYQAGKPEEALATWQTFRNAGQPLVLAELRLRPDVAWLSFTSTRNGYIGWLWNGSKLVHHQVTDEGIGNKIVHLSHLVNDPDSPQTVIKELASDLGNTLLSPFGAHLLACSRLVIDAEQSRSSIPWPLLIVNGHSLIETHAIVLSHGWREAAQHLQESNSRVTRALIVNRVTVKASAQAEFPLLVSGDRETQPLHSLEKYLELGGDRAASAKIITQLDESDLFHFSGHGLNWGSGGGLVVSAGNPNEPFGLLTASALSGHSWRHLRLVVLASCTSAGASLRANPNFESISHAFLQSGARQVIASRWNIDSVATADLLERFYQSFLPGESAAIALQKAMLAIKKLPNSSHPYYWSGFAVYGAP